MWHKIFFVGTILALVCIGSVCSYFMRTNDLFKQYQHYGFMQSHVQYQSVEKSWGQQGLIFYQLTFPLLPIPNHADKMRLKINDHGANIVIKRLSLNVHQGLQKLYTPQDMTQNLQDYQPYRDFFRKILTSLSILGMDEFVGDVKINTTYSDLKTMRFAMQIDQQGHPTLEITGILHIPVVGAHQLSDLWNGEIDSVNLRVLDSALLKKYINYAKSRKIELPKAFHKGIVEIQNLAQSFPKLSQIWW